MSFSSLSSEENLRSHQLPGREIMPNQSSNTTMIVPRCSDDAFAVSDPQLDQDVLIPQLLSLLDVQPAEAVKPGERLKSPSRSTFVLTKRPTVISKASGLFHRLKPQASLEKKISSVRSPRKNRPCSFEEGDDGLMGLTIGQGHELHRSISLSSLGAACVPSQAQDHRSFSPTYAGGPVSGMRSQSRIPTPTFASVTMARPRQDRVDSDSTFATAGQNIYGCAEGRSHTIRH